MLAANAIGLGCILTVDGYFLPLTERSESRDGYSSAIEMPAVQCSWCLTFLFVHFIEHWGTFSLVTQSAAVSCLIPGKFPVQRLAVIFVFFQI